MDDMKHTILRIIQVDRAIIETKSSCMNTFNKENEAKLSEVIIV